MADRTIEDFTFIPNAFRLVSAASPSNQLNRNSHEYETQQDQAPETTGCLRCLPSKKEYVGVLDRAILEES